MATTMTKAMRVAMIGGGRGGGGGGGGEGGTRRKWSSRRGMIMMTAIATNHQEPALLQFHIMC